MAYSNLDQNTQARLVAIGNRIGKTGEEVTNGIDEACRVSRNDFYSQGLPWFEDASHDASLVETINRLNNSATATASGVAVTAVNPNATTVSVPVAPQLVAGGNLVAGTNARYNSLFAIKQQALQVAGSALNAQENAMTGKQSALADAQRQSNFFGNEVATWQSRHHGCGPLSRYGCGECDTQEQRNQSLKNQQDAIIASTNAELTALQETITRVLMPQFRQAMTDLEKSYADYNTDVQGALAQERTNAQTNNEAAAATQNVLNSANPAYWAQKAQEAEAKSKREAQDRVVESNITIQRERLKAETDLKAADLKSKSQTKKLTIIGVVVLAVAVLVVVLLTRK